MGVYLFGDLTVVNVSKAGLNTLNKAFVVHPTPSLKLHADKLSKHS